MAEKKNQDREEQNNILQQSLALMERDEWVMVDLSRLNNDSGIGEQVKQINELDSKQKTMPILKKCLELLNDFDITGDVDPAQAKLRQEMNDAAAELNFDKAKTLKEELEHMEHQQSDQAKKGWASTSKNIARLGRKLNHDGLLNLSTSLQPPSDIDAISEQFRIEFGNEVSAIEDNVHVLEGLKSSAIAEIQLHLERSSSGSTKSESSVPYEQNITVLDEKINLLKRKVTDLHEEYQALISPLPEEVHSQEKEELERGMSDAILAQMTFKEIAASGKSWQNTHRVRYQNEELWMDLRKDWIEALNDTSESSIDDLKSLYLELVNVHGVTTAQSGSWHWYGEHATEPFDVVIIDEISKATPPEIILPSLLGRKVIWVGDHRQLAPEFNDPKKKTSEDEDTYDGENEDGKGRFRDMVTTALFERHFIGAHESLKSSLNVQYRMHQQIMSAINPFYEGKLQCGLTVEAQEINKQHGISIRKKDSWGLENKGSELIHPRRHMYWVDSALTRKNMYCGEEKIGTSYFNAREIELAEHLFEEINTQVGEWKRDINRLEELIELQQSGEPELSEKEAQELLALLSKQKELEANLSHVDRHGTLPVAFITFYAAQKSQFDTKVFAGSSNTTENRWKHLNIRVDTVDRFQGAESPIVIVSMVRSAPLRKGDQANLKRLLEQQAPSQKILVNSNANKDQVNIKPPHTGFAKSPNRVNVAYSRAQNLLIVLGNRWAWNGVKVNIKRDDGEKERFPYYKQLMNNTIRGGMLDGRNLL
jgi:superfamily I DNA and/or RNA helicase